MSTAIKQVGITFNDLDNLVGKFEGFDSAASAVGDLTSVFGVQMDAMEMMYLANENEEEFLFRLREQLLDQGINLETMSDTRKRFLANQLNMNQQQLHTFFLEY